MTHRYALAYHTITILSIYQLKHWTVNIIQYNTMLSNINWICQRTNQYHVNVNQMGSGQWNHGCCSFATLLHSLQLNVIADNWNPGKSFTWILINLLWLQWMQLILILFYLIYFYFNLSSDQNVIFIKNDTYKSMNKRKNNNNNYTKLPKHQPNTRYLK